MGPCSADWRIGTTAYVILTGWDEGVGASWYSDDEGLLGL